VAFNKINRKEKAGSTSKKKSCPSYTIKQFSRENFEAISSVQLFAAKDWRAFFSPKFY